MNKIALLLVALPVVVFLAGCDTDHDPSSSANLNYPCHSFELGQQRGQGNNEYLVCKVAPDNSLRWQ